jgi:hypothetical protein
VTDRIVSRGRPDPHRLSYVTDSNRRSAYIHNGPTSTSGYKGEGELESSSGCYRGSGSGEMGNGTMASGTRSGTESVSPYRRTS